MVTARELDRYHIGFELGDIFGKGRMRELLYTMKRSLAEANAETEKWKGIAMAQSQIIPVMFKKLTAPEENAKQENEALIKELARAIEMQNSLKEYAEDLELKIRKYEQEERERKAS